MFVDNLFTYGTGCLERQSSYKIDPPQQMRLEAYRSLLCVVKFLQEAKNSVKSVACRHEEDDLKQLVLASLSILHEFFDKLKRQLKRAEKLVNFDPDDIGHIVALTVGHRSKPTEPEVAYISTVFKEA